MTRSPLPALLWASLPLLLYAFLLHHLWFNAPVWDDYEAILDSTMRLMDASSAKEWLATLAGQHNEHRIVVVRLVAWAMAKLSGTIDFHVLVLIGNLPFVGILVLAWTEFRDELPAPLFAAAAFLLLQLSYYEAALMATTALSNIGVLFFAFACLAFALRAGRLTAAWTILFGLLAAGTLASGLFALPIAAGGCAIAGKRRRAWLFAAAAVALWICYFRGYTQPPNHPSLMVALHDPFAAMQLFLILFGGVIPGRWAPIGLGAIILIVVAWLARKGVWKAHPTWALWIAFLLVSAGATVVGRAGFGVFDASRYKLYSSCFIALAFLSACTLIRPWSRRMLAFAVVACAAVSFAVSAMSWQRAKDYSFSGHLLAKAVPASPDVSADRYFGILHPNIVWATPVLVETERRGLFSPKEVLVFPSSIRMMSALPSPARVAGHVDDVHAEQNRLVISGWTDIQATIPGRVFEVFPADGAPSALHIAATARAGVAEFTGESRLVFSGFRIEAEYPSEAQARAASSTLCVAVEAPGYPTAVLTRGNVSCALAEGTEPKLTR
jgi:hypothetical protein